MKIFPIYVIFLLLMNISANYTGELFPCSIRALLNSNIYLKHIVAWLTLLFFVVLDKIDTDNNSITFLNMSITTSIMYFVFIILSKCDFYFFIAATGILALCYLLRLQRIHITSNTQTETSQEELEQIDYAMRLLAILLGFILVLGFLLYMGAKKIEFGRKFNYLKFMFNKPVCTQTYKTRNYSKFIKAAFS
jgi:hypothetical protein